MVRENQRHIGKPIQSIQSNGIGRKKHVAELFSVLVFFCDDDRFGMRDPLSMAYTLN